MRVYLDGSEICEPDSDNMVNIEPEKKEYIIGCTSNIKSRIRAAHLKRQLLKLNKQGELEKFMKDNPLKNEAL